MPSPQFSQFQSGPFQGQCLRRKRLSFQLNPQQFSLCRRQYFLIAVILCFFTDASLPQAQPPYRDKCLDNHHALKVIRVCIRSDSTHVPPLFHALWYSSISQQPARLQVSGVFPWSSNAVLWLKLMVVVSSSARSSGCASHALAVAVNPASATACGDTDGLRIRRYAPST